MTQLDEKTRLWEAYLTAVVADEFEFVFGTLVLLFLLNGGNDAPRSTASAYHVLVGDAEQVPLLDRQFNVHRGHLLHGLDHFCKEKHKNEKEKHMN